MWTTILSFVKGKVFSEAGSLIVPLLLIVSIFVLWNGETILTKFGFETTAAMKAKVATLEAKVNTLEEANKKLTSDLKKAEEKGGILSDASSSVCVFQQETTDKTEDLTDRRKKEADKINKTHYDLPAKSKVSSAPNPTERVNSVQRNSRIEALSMNNIKTLHEAYNVLIKGEQS